MLLLRLPGVYGPQADTTLLIEAIEGGVLPPRGRVLDIGTGTGVVAVAAARAGAREVTAVDVSRRAVLAARLNTRLRRLPVRVERGDALERAGGREFDVVLANPPYVPAERSSPPTRGRARCWDAGQDGRALLDPLCATAPHLLAPGGTFLLVHSALAGVERSLEQLRGSGLKAGVITRHTQPFGPVMRRRAALFEGLGLIEPGQRYEELVVIRGERPE